MSPGCSTLTGGFDFSGCGDCTSCPPIERAEMSNREPRAIVLNDIACIGGLYRSSESNGENGSLRVQRWRRLRGKRSAPAVAARGDKIPPDVVPRHDEQEDHAHQAGESCVPGVCVHGVVPPGRKRDREKPC